MKATLIILALIVLTIIFYQDLKERLVSVVLFPLLAILSLFWFIFFQNIGIDLAKNLLFLCVLFLGTTFYFSIKNKKLTNLLTAYFGLGDVLFLVSITPLFSAQNMVLYIVSGLIISLILHAVMLFFVKTAVYTIPLAGYLSLYLIVLVSSSFMFKVNLLVNPIL